MMPRFLLLMMSLLLDAFFSMHSLTAQENEAAPVAREDALPQRRVGDQQRRDDRARKEKQIIFWFSTITAGTISGIALLFFLIARGQRAKAVRLQDATLSELWSLPHLCGLDPQAYDLWVLSPPANSMSSYWTLLSRQDDLVFGLKILRRGRTAEWEGNGPSIHFHDTQDIHRVNGPIEVAVDGEVSFPIERTQLMGLGGFQFHRQGDNYQILHDSKRSRIELHRQGSVDAVSDLASKYGPRVIAVNKESKPVILLIFAYIVLLR